MKSNAFAYLQLFGLSARDAQAEILDDSCRSSHEQQRRLQQLDIWDVESKQRHENHRRKLKIQQQQEH